MSYYKPLPTNLTIKESLIEGLGLFATQFIAIGTDLGMTHIYDKRFEDNYIRLPLGGFFNHSEDPNCKIVKIQACKDKNLDLHLRLITIKDIKAGEEITAKYTLYNPTLN
jgi:SET domain-containing protein